MEDQKTTTQNEDVKTAQDLEQESIAKLKAKMDTDYVPKQSYLDLQAKYKTLTDDIMNGNIEPNEAKTSESSTEEIQRLREELFQSEKELTNLEYVTKSLRLRELVLKEDGYDIFTPGKQSTQIDQEIAAQTADDLQTLVDESDGDSRVFTAKLQGAMVDPSLIRGRR